VAAVKTSCVLTTFNALHVAGDSALLHVVDDWVALSGGGKTVMDDLGAAMGGAIGGNGSKSNILFAPGVDGGERGVVNSVQGIILQGTGGGCGPNVDCGRSRVYGGDFLTRLSADNSSIQLRNRRSLRVKAFPDWLNSTQAASLLLSSNTHLGLVARLVWPAPTQHERRRDTHSGQSERCRRRPRADLRCLHQIVALLGGRSMDAQTSGNDDVKDHSTCGSHSAAVWQRRCRSTGGLTMRARFTNSAQPTSNLGAWDLGSASIVDGHNMHGRFDKGDLERDAGTLGGIGSFEICDSVTMNPGSGVYHMGGGVTDVGTSDGGGRRPGGGSNGARGVDGGENIVGPNGGFLGAHNGKPLGKLTGSLLGSLSGNAILGQAVWEVAATTKQASLTAAKLASTRATLAQSVLTAS
jgi:hypothetical protein